MANSMFAISQPFVVCLVSTDGKKVLCHQPADGKDLADGTELDSSSDIATLFTSEEKIRHYYILKLFPFSVKDDAKTWFTCLAPGRVRSPQDMVYYFCEKYFPAHKKQAALQEIFNFAQAEEESLPQAWGRLVQLLNALPVHPLEKNEILDVFYNGLTDASKYHLDSCALDWICSSSASWRR